MREEDSLRELKSDLTANSIMIYELAFHPFIFLVGRVCLVLKTVKNKHRINITWKLFAIILLHSTNIILMDLDLKTKTLQYFSWINIKFHSKWRILNSSKLIICSFVCYTVIIFLFSDIKFIFKFLRNLSYQSSWSKIKLNYDVW